MAYDAWKTTEPDPFADDARDESERCPVCRADEDEPCEPSCDCQICLNAAEVMAARRAEGGLTSSERASLERDSMVEALKLK